MITIKRNDTAVSIAIESGLPVKQSVYLFSWQANDENWAELLADRLRTRLWNLMSGIRRESYMKGYRDGRAKKRREDWFDGGLE